MNSTREIYVFCHQQKLRAWGQQPDLLFLNMHRNDGFKDPQGSNLYFEKR